MRRRRSKDIFTEYAGTLIVSSTRQSIARWCALIRAHRDRFRPTLGGVLSSTSWKQEVWRALQFDSKEAFMAGFLEPPSKGSELRDINDVLGHLGLFGARRTCMPQIDKAPRAGCSPPRSDPCERQARVAVAPVACQTR